MSLTQKCKVDGCTELGRLHSNGNRYFAKGLCNMHWIRHTRKKTVGDSARIQYHHGLSKHSLYSTWEGMNQRCNNKNHKAYHNYGGRGIEVCDRWKNFGNFLEDMGEKPTPRHTIDRIDNNKGYSPENCVWATRTEQAINQRLKNTNTSGNTGVKYDKSKELWYATITIDGTEIYLGSSAIKHEAILMRYSAEAVRSHILQQIQNPS